MSRAPASATARHLEHGAECDDISALDINDITDAENGRAQVGVGGFGLAREPRDPPSLWNLCWFPYSRCWAMAAWNTAWNTAACTVCAS